MRRRDSAPARARVAATPPIRIREIADASDPALTGAYALLSRSFTREERVGLEAWRGSLAERAGGPAQNANVYADIFGLVLGEFTEEFEDYMSEEIRDVILYAGDPGEISLRHRLAHLLDEVVGELL